ncbi:arylamine N-acetyltransferase family protein [Macrococcus equipercicus]|nr:arylamine N-acetyltransferase [Macrococcus equipercicus]
MNIHQIDQYLNITADAALEDYMRAFMLKIPFENINVQNNIPISTSTDDLFDKIIINHRGGFCYELNTFFRAYLTAKGFHAYNAAATVKSPHGWALEGSHMTTLVQLDRLYIADVGFGDLPMKPVPLSALEAPDIVDDINGRFRAIQTGGRFELQKETDGSFNTLYKGLTDEKSLADFAAMIDYNQHNPQSIFVQNLLITKAQADGRVSMSQDHLTITKNGDKQKIKLTAENYRELLNKYFGLDTTIDRLEQLN